MIKFILCVLVALILISIGMAYFSNRHYGRHHGAYQPSIHWGHVRCYPNGVCHIATHKGTLHFYQPYPNGIDLHALSKMMPTLPDAQTIRFTESGGIDDNETKQIEDTQEAAKLSSENHC